MNILMISESGFPCDVRIRQEANLLANNGHNITVIGIKGENETYHEKLDGINVYRLPKIELFKSGKGDGKSNKKNIKIVNMLKAILGYGIEYLYFTIFSLLLSIYIYPKSKFDTIHLHNPPDTLALVALFWKIFGKKYVYDHHDLAPELYNEKYGGSKGRLIHKILVILERISCRYSNIVIATNKSYKENDIKNHSIDSSKIYVVRNGPDTKRLKRTKSADIGLSNGESVLCYLGSINNQDGVDYLIEIIKKLKDEHDYKKFKLLIIGDGDFLSEIKRIAKEYDVIDNIYFTGFVRDPVLLNEYLSTADIFVDAAPGSSYNHNSTFIKHMEYMIFEKPIITFNLKESRYSLKNSAIYVKPNKTEVYAKKIIKLIHDKKLCEILAKNANKRVEQLTWDRVSLPLLDAYNNI